MLNASSQQIRWGLRLCERGDPCAHAHGGLSGRTSPQGHSQWGRRRWPRACHSRPSSSKSSIPEVIVALGATAVQGLLGTTEGITRLRDKWRLYQGRIAVMPTFHPAYLLRTPAAKRDVWEDLQAVLRHVGRPIPERK